MATLGIIVAPCAQAQTYTLLHAFNNAGDGAYPQAGVTLDAAGNLYGTTTGYEQNTTSTVYKLSRAGSGWRVSVLHTFAGGTDGAAPYAGVVFGPDGTLYGTTASGGLFNNGTVYNLRPPASPCLSAECPWVETILYNFTGLADGAGPWANLTFDSAGNIYSTTIAGGTHGKGVVFELSRSGETWTESVLYSFKGVPVDGANPESSVTFDSAGNLYGTTAMGGYQEDVGTIYELSPSQSGWTETVLFNFNPGSSGYTPYSGVVFDPQGNFYGTTSNGGGLENAGGTIYQMEPSGDSWIFNVLYSFNLGPNQPYDTPTLDAAGNLYGTTSGGPAGTGSIFELTRGSNGWTYSNLYEFAYQGYQPHGGVAFDHSGNLYGTTFYGGNYPQGCGSGCGVVWELVP